MGAAPERDDKEVFLLMPVPSEELRQIDFCTDVAEAMFVMAQHCAGGLLPQAERKHLLRLLSELSAFIIGAPYAVEDPLQQKGLLVIFECAEGVPIFLLLSKNILPLCMYVCMYVCVCV